MLKKLLLFILVCVTLTGCSSTPDAWLFHAGMSKSEAQSILDDKGLTYSESGNELNVEEEIEYLDQSWDSMSISFNDQEQIDQVAFYHSDENNRIYESEVIETISKQLGEPSGSMGDLTTWSKDEKWLVTFADNEAPYPQTLTYWFTEYMPKDNQEE